MKTLENFAGFSMSTESTTEVTGGRRSYAEVRRRRLAARRRRLAAAAAATTEPTQGTYDASQGPSDPYLNEAAAAFINLFNQG